MDAIQILSDKKLNITRSRKFILDVLLDSNVALSEKEIKEKLKQDCNRATIYRTLNLFCYKEIVHPVLTEKNTTKYVIRKEPENHLHFKCTSCKQIICLTDIRIGNYTLPDGYVQSKANFLVSGTCKNCNPC